MRWDRLRVATRGYPVQPISPIVLIVGDREESIAMHAFGLLAMGFQPLMAYSLEDAFARACQFNPSVIVTEAKLAGASALDLIRRLRGDPRTKDTGTIVLTLRDSAREWQQAAAAGCDRLVVTPCMPDALAFEIRDLLHARNDRRTGPS